MENIFNFNGIEIDQELLERTNPIFHTARMTLFQLAAAGNDDARDLVERLNLTRKDTQDSKTVKADEDDLFVNSVIMDVRYFTIGKLAMESGFTVVDLPCGFTPRALEFAKSGRKYVGMDLPATINEVEPAIMSLLGEERKKLVSFEGVDATNYQSLKSAFDKIDGEVCITTEGLLMYLTDSEMDAMCENIKKILAEHGGYWITLDPEISPLYVLIVKAFYGDRTREIMWRSKYRIDDKSIILNPKDLNWKGSLMLTMCLNSEVWRMLTLRLQPISRKDLRMFAYGRLALTNLLMLTFAMPKLSPLMLKRQLTVTSLTWHYQGIWIH